jgi:mannose-6-phosphate isomerase-like protein (cupin superfamily)
MIQAGVAEEINSMSQPIIATGTNQSRISAAGTSLVVQEWAGSGPDYLHVHYADDEAWHILEGTLTFRFANSEIEAQQGTTIFVPAGVPHTYYEAYGPTRYLIILTPRLLQLISELQSTPYQKHREVMQRFDSEIIER